MRKTDYLKVLLLFSCCSIANAEVRISEIMTNNVSTIVSDKYNYDGYVEFFNDGGNVDLKGWTVTNYKGDKVDWSAKLDSTHIVPNGYSLLFFGKSETGSVSASKVQKNYVGRVGQKLTTDQGSLVIEKDGKKIEIAYPAQRPHLSYCQDGFMAPTPGKENDKLVTSLSNRVAQPYFKSVQPGLYDSESSLLVELACATDGAVIYYAVNGERPTPEKGTRYNGPIKIDSTTALRAVAYKDGMLFSEMQTGTYILAEEHYTKSKDMGERLPVVSLSLNQEDVSDSIIGFYVVGKNGINGCSEVANYNQDWMRSANFEYILDGKVVDNQEVEVGVYGGCTRVHVAKSLKIKANKRSGKNKMNYTSFFPNRSYTKYKSLALRNGGNGYAYVQPRWRDMFIQSLAQGMNLDLQVAQPVSYYLNGKFYGMMILTERTDEDYIYHNYGLDEEDIDLLHVSTGYVCDKGTKEAYDKMINFVSTSYNNADFYDKLGTHMDIDEYIDYQILEQYVGNTDWVTNNTKMWRKHDGGKFRWIVFDTDFGFSRGTKLDTCMLDFTTTLMKAGSLERSIILQKSCMQNEDFRWRFLDQYIDRLENHFTDQRIDTKIDSLKELTERDMYVTIKNSGPLGCPGSVAEHDLEVEKMRVFAKERKNYVVEQLKKAYGLGDEKVDLKVRFVFPNNETPEVSYLINKREFNDFKHNSWRYINERVRLEVNVPYGYKIHSWAVNNIYVKDADGKKFLGNEMTAIADSTELKFSIYFDYDPDCVLPEKLYLNEVCASNESTLDENGETSDWIEVYNGSDSDADLAGITIENEAKHLAYTFPCGSTETVVPAHGYKLLWADKNPEVGPLHLNFKMGVAEAEKITLHRYYRDADVELSSITTTPHEKDESYGRETDGAATMKLFGKCTDTDGNVFATSTPLAANGSIECSQTAVTPVAANGMQVFAEGKKVCVLNAKGCNVRVYSLLGDVVANQKATADQYVMAVPNPGVYLVKVEKECWKVVVE